MLLTEGLRIASYVEDQVLNFPAQSGGSLPGLFRGIVGSARELGVMLTVIFFMCVRSTAVNK